MSRLTGQFGELSFNTEMIEVTSNLPKPDENWRHTDSSGHEHYWTSEGWPTLKRIVDDTWTDEDGEEIEESHLACELCGETVVPGMKGPNGFREFVPGRRSYLLNGQPISTERAEEIMELYRQARP